MVSWPLWNWQEGTITVHCYVTLIFPCDGKRDRRGGDLRDKLDKRLSPHRRISPGRNTRSQHTFHGASSSRSLEKSRDRKRRKKQHFDGQSDLSGSLKSLDGAKDWDKIRKSTSTDSVIVLKKQLIEVQSEIDMLDQQKSHLKTLEEEKVEEAEILTSRILELDSQLSKEKEEYRRTISKIKKFVKTHKRYVRAQEDLKRSQIRLQRLGDHLGSDTATGGNEEDSSINIVSDGDAPGYHAVCPQNEVQNNYSPGKKVLFVKHDTAEELAKCGNLTNGGVYHTGPTRLRKRSQFNAHAMQSAINKEVEMLDSGDYGHQPTTNESKQKRGKSISASIQSADKPKGSGLGLPAPSTSMAAHAIDELVEIEAEENIEVVETASGKIDKGASTCGVRRLPFLLPPPLPVPRNTYSQHKGKDENVDVEGLEEEMVEVDIV
ncbi:zinc finger CCCH domain-containing protein 13 isoform X2 [Manihot esculenta]|uniref:Uncharacterized protein n=4 Tax=Manihot esculenta TaxID=3983 RepID=A0ACB7GQU9_MANES|nr:zinc finger CCCH domain-containing protein 13 isoform X2 [Manihot esculenta]XP_043804681.1 zinc finger CCCH domain-containing protein 13 isoform X2 [Manihot esculenta]XP_043804682.1 zinc finger CCCH domain-containing protein 13 isoform X2 [Manihot esculenta]KAG8642327.1 hypothetical protein MANES_12G077600v8 [Manihot esculenta]KAG8642329.1 hypothetical protein MANES_12G077600v8 [Manihot esculenta]KAG8642330.1 hypothetical protein MANES_12G077600v8 [Manihot esculenta]OAY35168.1 hypothetical